MRIASRRVATRIRRLRIERDLTRMGLRRRQGSAVSISDDLKQHGKIRRRGSLRGIANALKVPLTALAK